MTRQVTTSGYTLTPRLPDRTRARVRIAPPSGPLQAIARLSRGTHPPPTRAGAQCATPPCGSLNPRATDFLDAQPPENLEHFFRR
jgi:hypothetical protein